MDIKVKKRTDRSIELTFSDISTRTTIPLSLSDALNLQSGIATSLKNTFAGKLVLDNEPSSFEKSLRREDEEEWKAEEAKEDEEESYISISEGLPATSKRYSKGETK